MTCDPDHSSTRTKPPARLLTGSGVTVTSWTGSRQKCKVRFHGAIERLNAPAEDYIIHGGRGGARRVCVSVCLRVC